MASFSDNFIKNLKPQKTQYVKSDGKGGFLSGPFSQDNNLLNLRW